MIPCVIIGAGIRTIFHFESLIKVALNHSATGGSLFSDLKSAPYKITVAHRDTVGQGSDSNSTPLSIVEELGALNATHHGSQPLFPIPLECGRGRIGSEGP